MLNRWTTSFLALLIAPVVAVAAIVLFSNGAWAEAEEDLADDLKLLHGGWSRFGKQSKDERELTPLIHLPPPDAECDRGGFPAIFFVTQKGRPLMAVATVPFEPGKARSADARVGFARFELREKGPQRFIVLDDPAGKGEIEYTLVGDTLTLWPGSEVRTLLDGYNVSGRWKRGVE